MYQTKSLQETDAVRQTHDTSSTQVLIHKKRVLIQVKMWRCSGMHSNQQSGASSESILRLTKVRYPTRRPYEGFLARYSLLCRNMQGRSVKEKIQSFMSSIGATTELYQLGIT